MRIVPSFLAKVALLFLAITIENRETFNYLYLLSVNKRLLADGGNFNQVGT